MEQGEHPASAGTSLCLPQSINWVAKLTCSLGIVYKPLKELSLYASYSQSFNPNTEATSASGKPLEPERGEDYEIGVKAELLGSILLTLAYFDITKQNVATADQTLQILVF